MRFYFLLLGLALLIAVFAFVAILVTGSDLLRRRRERREGKDASVIADSEIELESDVGRSSPDL